MKQLGFALFLGGVILSSWYAARLVPDSDVTSGGESSAMSSMERLQAWGDLAGVPFGIGILLMVGGGVMSRRGRARGAPGGNFETGAASAGRSGNILTLLEQIEQAVTQLPTQNVAADADELHHALDRILEDLIPSFLEQRSHQIDRMGLGDYAEMISVFATAERTLARAWSALTDEAWFEVQPNIDRARESLGEAIRIASRPANSGAGPGPGRSHEEPPI